MDVRLEERGRENAWNVMAFAGGRGLGEDDQSYLPYSRPAGKDRLVLTRYKRFGSIERDTDRDRWGRIVV